MLQPRYSFPRTLLTIFLALTSSSPFADNRPVRLSSGDEAALQRFEAEGDTAILWTPSGFGMQPPASVLARKLASGGLEVWLADLHETFFVQPGRHSVDKFEPALLAELFDRVLAASGKKKLLLMTTGSGAKPVLGAVRHWQLSHPGNPALAGMILFHPSLYAGRPPLGEQARYLPVTAQTNLPVFIVQPTLSTTHFRVTELQKKLQLGGAQVYLQVLPGVRDGFHVRPDDHLEDADRIAKQKLPALVGRAATVLLQTATPTMASLAEVDKQVVADTPPGLKRITLDTTPPLALVDLSGKMRRLEDYRGQVVLVSFWASWCPPCIKEMPSMNRLKRILKGKPFTILGVNVGEEKAVIQDFLKKTKVDFTLLLDRQRSAYDDWNIYVVPSNFIVDPEGVIRFGSVGAVEWDSPDTVRLLENLVAGKAS